MTNRNGFTSVPNWIIHNQALHPTAKAVYLALASHADQHGRCWPGHQLLATEVGCSVDTVQRSLQALRAEGAVTWRKRGASNLYRVAVGQMKPLTEAAPMRLEETAPMRSKQDPGEQDPGTTPAATASEAPELVLISEDDVEPVKRPPNGSDLFDAWWRGYEETYGHAPDAAVHGRLRGQVANVVKTRTDTESWRRAWQAFLASGKRGDFNVVAELLRTQSRYTQQRTNHHLAAAEVAAQSGLLGEMLGGWDPVNHRPAIGGTA